MLITLGKIELCRGEAFSEVPIDFKINGERKIQKTPRIRAQNMWVSDRGNLANEITFKVTRKHSTHEEAAKYALLHGSDFNAYEPLCYFISEKTGATIVLQQCALESVQCQIIGTATVAVYHLIGGALILINSNNHEK